MAATARRYVTITAPILGDVRLQSLTVREMRVFRDSLTDDVGKINERGKRVNELLVAQCAVDGSGNRVFSDDDAMADWFGEMDGGPVASIYPACVRHTNYRSDPDWKAIEDAAKNSDATG